MEYANGKLLKVYRTDKTGLTENYTYKSAIEAVITRNFSDGSVGNTFNATLNDKGYFTKFSQISNVAPFTIVSTYDPDGYLKTQVATYPNSASDNSNLVNTITNGNLIKSVTYNSKGILSYTTDYTYYEDKLNKVDLIANGNRPDTNGKFSKNLIKTFKITYADKKIDLYEYTYDLNANGFVKSLTEKYTAPDGKVSTQINTYDYVCL